MLAEGLDQAALERLHERLERSLFNVAYRWLWIAEDAEEVVQEAFVRLWRMRRRVRAATVEPLVYRIVLNLARSRLRRRRLWRWVSMQDAGEPVSDAPDATELACNAERRQRLRQAMEALPEDLRRVITLCELSELRYDQVAAVLGIPIGTVGSRRHRALKRLRAILDEAEEGSDERA